MRLQGKVAVITGGGTGIGRDAALALAREGARVAVTGIPSQSVEETAQLIQAEGGQALAVPGDVTSFHDIDHLKNLITTEWGQVDILVNNAGVVLRKPFMETTLEEFDHIYRVDLRAVFAVSQAFVPLMKKQGSGSIINVSSILGVFGAINSSAYCAAKGGVTNLTRALAAELGPDIRVNCICPGHINTPMMEEPLRDIKARNKWDRLQRMFPMKRIGYPPDTSGAILFFASNDSAWITGTALLVDGGLSCFV